MTDFATTASNLAAYGWPVFPLQPGSKIPATDHGCKDATTNLKLIAGWWKRWPDANIGIATGLTEAGDGPDVLDIDIQKSKKFLPGDEGMEIMRVAGMLNGAGPIVRTPSGGLHIYFKGTKQGNAAYIGQSYPIDFRSIGGYVVSPPSIVDGKRYVAERSRKATRMFDLAAAKELLAPPAKPPEKDYTSEYQRSYEDEHGSGDGSVGALVRFVENAEHGERRHCIFWSLCTAAREGYDLEPIIDAAVQTHGLERRDIERQARNAKRIAG